MRRFANYLIVFALAISAGVVWAQAPAPAAATAPATRPRYVFPVPPGFEKVTAGSHTAVCATEDAAWVRQALGAVKPGTRPATMPTDLLKRLADNRPALVKQMVTDLALPDDRHVSQFIDNKLIDTLRKLETIQPPILVFVVSREKLRDLVKGGWGEPRFKYNRAADAASYDENVMLSIDRPMDESPLPAFYDPKEPEDKRVEGLARNLALFDSQLAKLISEQSQTGVFNLFAQYLGEQHFDPLKLRRDQQWLGLGLATYLSAKYASLVTGIGRDAWLRGIMYEDLRYMLGSASIDLTNPTPEESMRPGAAGYYTQAMRRKATGVVLKLVENGGEGAIPKALIAVVKTKPADGKQMVKTIQEATGVDLTKELGPQ
jgi:uncharacterized protein YidB (DUF937 family)